MASLKAPIQNGNMLPRLLKRWSQAYPTTNNMDYSAYNSGKCYNFFHLSDRVLFYLNKATAT